MRIRKRVLRPVAAVASTALTVLAGSPAQATPSTLRAEAAAVDVLVHGFLMTGSRAFLITDGVFADIDVPEPSRIPRTGSATTARWWVTTATRRGPGTGYIYRAAARTPVFEFGTGWEMPLS